MTDKFTAQVHELKGKGKKIELFGDKSTPESAQQIVIFPGGNIEVTRTSTGEYWVHISVNKSQILPETIRMKKLGKIIDTRLDYSDGIREIPNPEDLLHLAVKIGVSND